MDAPMQATMCICICECRCVSAQEGKRVLWLSATCQEMSGSSVPSVGTYQPCSWMSFYPLHAITSSLAELGELLPVSANAGWDVGCGCYRQGRAEPFWAAEPGWGRQVGATEHHPGAFWHLCSAPVPLLERSSLLSGPRTWSPEAARYSKALGEWRGGGRGAGERFE